MVVVDAGASSSLTASFGVAAGLVSTGVAVPVVVSAGAPSAAAAAGAAPPSAEPVLDVELGSAEELSAAGVDAGAVGACAEEVVSAAPSEAGAVAGAVAGLASVVWDGVASAADAGCKRASANAAAAKKATPKRPVPVIRFPLAANGVSSR